MIGWVAAKFNVVSALKDHTYYAIPSCLIGIGSQKSLTCMGTPFDDVEVVTEPGGRVLELGRVEEEDDMVMTIILYRRFAHGWCPARVPLEGSFVRG